MAPSQPSFALFASENGLRDPHLSIAHHASIPNAIAQNSFHPVISKALRPNAELSSVNEVPCDGPKPPNIAALCFYEGFPSFLDQEDLGDCSER
jgi:hypothetical protein